MTTQIVSDLHGIKYNLDKTKIYNVKPQGLDWFFWFQVNMDLNKSPNFFMIWAVLDKKVYNSGAFHEVLWNKSDVKNRYIL